MPHNAILDDRIISIDAAIKGECYLCPDCHSELRVKRGLVNRPHFYHLKTKQCHRYNHEEHLAVQAFIQRKIPTVKLEVHYPHIRRIADVVWEEKGIIFEVQVSPISLEELQQRNQDYGSIGLRVIWILHTKNFNKRKLQPVEKYLQSTLTYYTDINNKGYGKIFKMKKRPRRRFVKPAFHLNLDPFWDWLNR